MKRSRHETGKKKRPLSRKCRSYLSQKIATNIHERRYKSRQQAIAVAYSQLGNKYPTCKRTKQDGNNVIKSKTKLCDNSLKINRRKQFHLESIVFGEKFENEFEHTNKFKHLKINKYSFDVVKSHQIGNGSYSKVYKLYDRDHQVKLALKIESNNFPSEKEISEKLLDEGCHTVKERYIGSVNNNHYYLMNLAEGTLEDLKDKTSDYSDEQKRELYLTVTEEVRKQVLCLLELGYVYTDFKLANIFYDCPEDDLKSFKIYLGDLGSAITNHNNDHVSTYPPVDINDEADTKGIFNLTAKDKKAVLSWGIGIILWMFIDPNDAYDFLYSEPIPSQSLHHRIMEKMNQFYGNYYGDYLEFMGVSRRSISKQLI
jgi:hypothetical protein